MLKIIKLIGNQEGEKDMYFFKVEAIKLMSSKTIPVKKKLIGVNSKEYTRGFVNSAF